MFSSFSFLPSKTRIYLWRKRTACGEQEWHPNPICHHSTLIGLEVEATKEFDKRWDKGSVSQTCCSCCCCREQIEIEKKKETLNSRLSSLSLLAISGSKHIGLSFSYYSTWSVICKEEDFRGSTTHDGGVSDCSPPSTSSFLDKKKTTKEISFSPFFLVSMMMHVQIEFQRALRNSELAQPSLMILILFLRCGCFVTS